MFGYSSAYSGMSQSEATWAWILSYLFFHMIHAVSCLMNCGLKRWQWPERHQGAIREELDLQVFPSACLVVMSSQGVKCNAAAGLWTDHQNKSNHILAWKPIVFSLDDSNVFVRVCAQIHSYLHKVPKLCLPKRTGYLNNDNSSVAVMDFIHCLEAACRCGLFP